MQLKFNFLKFAFVLGLVFSFSSKAKKLYPDFELGLKPSYQIWLGSNAPYFNNSIGYNLYFLQRRKGKSEKLQFRCRGISIGYNNYNASNLPIAEKNGNIIFSETTQSFVEDVDTVTFLNHSSISLLLVFRHEIVISKSKFSFIWGIDGGLSLQNYKYIGSQGAIIDVGFFKNSPGLNLHLKLGILYEITKNFGVALENRYEFIITQYSFRRNENVNFNHIMSPNISIFARF